MDHLVRQSLEQAAAECGTWDPEVLESWAREHPNSPFAAALEWQDAKAAHQHRLSQIRNLVAQLVILPADRSRLPEVRLLVSVREPGERRREYLERAAAMAQPTLMLQARIDAWRSCITRITNLGVREDRSMIQAMQKHLAALERELKELAA